MFDQYLTAIYDDICWFTWFLFGSCCLVICDICGLTGRQVAEIPPGRTGLSMNGNRRLNATTPRQRRLPVRQRGACWLERLAGVALGLALLVLARMRSSAGSRIAGGVPEPKDVELLTKDGVKLHATYSASDRAREAVPLILLHGFKGSRADFDELRPISAARASSCSADVGFARPRREHASELWLRAANAQRRPASAGRLSGRWCSLTSKKPSDS